MISDELFRAQDIQKRAMFVRLVQDVKSYGGEVKIFSSMHVSGQRTFLAAYKYWLFLTF